MKRGIRILPVMLLIAAMTFVLSGCGPSLEGTWYELEENPDNTGHQLMICLLYTSNSLKEKKTGTPCSLPYVSPGENLSAASI